MGSKMKCGNENQLADFTIGLNGSRQAGLFLLSVSDAQDTAFSVSVAFLMRIFLGQREALCTSRSLGIADWSM